MRFYLIQRLSLSRRANATGFGSHFSLEYMGSAEYEFSTPNEALRRLRQHPLITFRHALTSPATGEKRPVYFVGHRERLLHKVEGLQEWLKSPRSKESSYFPERLSGLDWRGKPIDDFYTQTVAWWAYDEDVMWTLDKDIAAKLITAVENPAPK